MRKFLFILISVSFLLFWGCAAAVQQKSVKSVSDELFESAQNNVNKHRFNQAAFEYKQFMELYPFDDRFPDALYRLAYIQVVQSEYDEASETFERLLKEYPDNKWLFMAETWKKLLDDLDQAKSKTKTRKVYIEKEGEDNSDILEKCEEENEELRLRIEKLESIIEDQP